MNAWMTSRSTWTNVAMSWHFAGQVPTAHVRPCRATGHQAFIGTAPGIIRPLIEVLVLQVVHRLGQPMALSPSIRVVSPSAAPIRSASNVNGVATGKVDNCQVGVFMGYVSADTMRWLDFRCLPREWAHDEQRRHACHVRQRCVPKPPGQCLRLLDAWSVHVHMAGSPVMMSSVATRDFARSCVNVASGMCWGALHQDTRLEALHAYQGRGRRPKAPWQSVTAWRKSLDPSLETLRARW